jgi:hypothetical protein
LHPKINPKNHKKDINKKILLSIDSNNQVESSLNVDGNIFYTFVQKEVNRSIIYHQEEKDMTKLFHIKIQVKKTKIDALFDSGPQANLIATNLVNKLVLEVHDNPIPFPLVWVNKDVEIKVKKQCKIKFIVSAPFIDEVEVDVVPLDVCGVVFGIHYMYMRDGIFMRRAN